MSSHPETIPGAHDENPLVACRILWTGQVQGVGFRPFVYRTAKERGLKGWVQNKMGQVDVHVQGAATAVQRFVDEVIVNAPPLSAPHVSTRKDVDPGDFDDFSIVASSSDRDARIFVPPDYFTCDDCLRELRDQSDRRYRYPFVNCTQCGPRYTIIEGMPYDRPNTTMVSFELCPECRQEYEDPLDRRFHAEPIACPVCGPQLIFVSKEERIDSTPDALARAVGLLRQGKILAVKGVGGYHLMCDARNDEAVRRLRENKQRPDKPLAVMFPARGDKGIAALAGEVLPTKEEAALLAGPMRPIVLVRKDADCTLSRHVAPGLEEIGVFLPYSPLHHLLLHDFRGPLVTTSGNFSGEPVLTDNAQVDERLGKVADAFLHHDRPIVRPADDPVFRTLGSKPRPIRLGRGSAPLELIIPWQQPRPVLAVGGHMKNAIALSWENRVVISPHIGEMDSVRSLEVFEKVVDSLQLLYGVRAEAVVCDAHPGYTTTRWARECGLPVTRVFHHHAHASALVGEDLVAETSLPESRGDQNWLMFAWDGVGYGEDGTLWGGETLCGKPGEWRRVATLRPFYLPGGEKAGREPWRSAAALCWETGRDWNEGFEQDSLVRQAWEKRVNTSQTSSVGRLFDAAAAIVAGVQQASFEAQGPMLLEAMSGECRCLVEMPLRQNQSGVLETDWEPLLDCLLDVSMPAGERSTCFHASLARAMAAQVKALSRKYPVDRIGLSGGVFQNQLLVRLATQEIAAAGLKVRLSERVPCNDAGISFGQAVEHAAGHDV